jgi:hypothetical protein
MMSVGSEDVGGGRREVDGLPPQTSVFASAEGEQRLEQSFLAPAGGDDALAHLPQGSRVCARVGERRLGEHKLERDLAAQLVDGEGQEAFLRANHGRSSSAQPERIGASPER